MTKGEYRKLLSRLHGGVLFPYDIVHKYYQKSGNAWYRTLGPENEALEALWKELPETVLVLSDMEFDQAVQSNQGIRPDRRLFEEIAGRYRAAGYRLPRLAENVVDLGDCY